MGGDGSDDRTLVLMRLLERLELAVEQFRRHEVPVTRRETTAAQLRMALERARPAAAPPAAGVGGVDGLGGGAGENAMAADAAGRIDPGGNGLEPRPTVLLGERMPAMHFLDV